MASEPAPLSAADRELLERVAQRIVDLRIEMPAILTLESARPLSVIAGQALVFFQPLAEALFAIPDYRRFAALIERRDSIEALVTRIETLADAADAARRARRADRVRPPR